MESRLDRIVALLFVIARALGLKDLRQEDFASPIDLPETDDREQTPEEMWAAWEALRNAHNDALARSH